MKLKPTCHCDKTVIGLVVDFLFRERTHSLGLGSCKLFGVGQKDVSFNRLQKCNHRAKTRALQLFLGVSFLIRPLYL